MCMQRYDLALTSITCTLLMSSKVHIKDLVELFLIVFEKAVKGSPEDSPYERFYMGSTRLTSMKSIATALGAALHQRGKIDQAEPRSLTAQETGRIGA